METAWLHFDIIQFSVQPFINAIFFRSAVTFFVAVAYVPTFLEDRATFVRSAQMDSTGC